MSKKKILAEKLSFSKMKGTPGHCVCAQVFDGKGNSLAVINSDHEEKRATDYARLFSKAPKLYQSLEDICHNAAIIKLISGLDENSLLKKDYHKALKILKKALPND